MKRFPRNLLVTALAGVVGMAFRVSWNALHDVARTVGADDVAALLYPFVVDGLMALALVATLVLSGPDRRFALRVLAAYTLASLALNYVHGLVPELHGRSADWGQLADWDPANWTLVLLATSLPVGSIYFGSDLVAKVLHHRPAPQANTEESTQTDVNRSKGDLHESRPAPIMPAVQPLPTPAVQSGAIAPEPEPTPRPLAPAVAAAESTRPSRATGRLPQSARPARPARSAAQLLSEARSATAGWSDGELTAEGIRKAVHISAAKARELRETLRTEREGRAAEQRHQVEKPEVESAFAALAPGYSELAKAA
ncbi:DUF2637 domain-containing protein [Streptomyces iconiensis]|uniref:DUF2637 domain-containing protein n=1 Tax=Streptomyces iconiensis TaxID=1384038 RepID=A0ABT7AB63_9ACTN|nr:DUF2637 domain-containing protein [Streptomyces iconiensis]MDJ1138570.1 DUF2637 domain-containing protein [Streptomyces iconiensis]